ncbi:MAG: porphobilinogen synthase [Alicyclobacillus sp.]|nr:porphobilinogen synthase [Alicyclobacillus sp.]
MTEFRRHRRLRASANLRRMVRETRWSVDDLVYPLFVQEGLQGREPVAAMPGVDHLGLDELRREVLEVSELGIPAILLFGVPLHKDECSSSAYAEEGIVQQAVRAAKQENPELVVITDVCLCQYNPAGHCGVVRGGRVVNDESLELLVKTAVSHAQAGADVVAPSDMMDGRVAAIRAGLDAAGLTDVAIMSYAVKYASAFYGPFREAAHSAPAFGDRKTYQMDPANAREALREAWSDVAEGADAVMVKPALAYLDITRSLRAELNVPLATYNVSGEYSMVKAAARQGWIHEQTVVDELLTSFKRAGADMVITYHAKDAVRWRREEFGQG